MFVTMACTMTSLLGTIMTFFSITDVCPQLGSVRALSLRFCKMESLSSLNTSAEICEDRIKHYNHPSGQSVQQHTQCDPTIGLRGVGCTQTSLRLFTIRPSTWEKNSKNMQRPVTQHNDKLKDKLSDRVSCRILLSKMIWLIVLVMPTT